MGHPALRTPHPAFRNPHSAIRIPVVCVLLMLAVGLVYWPSLRHGFVNFDDPDYVVANPHVQAGLSWSSLGWAFTTYDAGNWHPLAWVSHIVDCQTYGLSPWGHHLTSVLLHMANTMLLFLALRRLTGAVWRSAFVAALFGLHPLHVESVAWVSERKDVLSAFFFFLTLWAYAGYAGKAESRKQKAEIDPNIEHRTSNAKHRGREVEARASKDELAAGGEKLERKTESNEPRTKGSEIPQSAADTLRSEGSPFKVRRSMFDVRCLAAGVSRSSPLVWYVLTLTFFSLGLLSKPMLVTVPFVLLLLDFWPLQRALVPGPTLRGQSSVVRRQSSVVLGPWSSVLGQSSVVRGLLLEKLPFFLLSALVCAFTYRAQAHSNYVADLTLVPVGMRVQNAILSYAKYLWQMLWPEGLAAFYPMGTEPDEAMVGFAALVLVAVTAASVGYIRRLPFLAVGWFWYLGMLVPVIGLVQVGLQSMADRYTYLPLTGVFVAVAWGVGEWVAASRSPAGAARIVSGAGVLLLAACGVAAHAQLAYWKDSETLFRRAIAVTGENPTARINLGVALLNKNQFQEAAEHFQEAVRLRPASPYAHSNLGFALAMLGQTDRAIEEYRASIALNPTITRPHALLGNALVGQGRRAEAIPEYRAALKLDPDWKPALNDLAWLLASAPDPAMRNGAEAVTLAERLCRLTENKEPQFLGTLAAAYAEAGRYEDAVKTAQQAITLAEAQGQKDLAARNQQLLETYRSRKPFHEQK